jgi:ATP-binding cassette subfamily B (MDR/TAP) protein 8
MTLSISPFILKPMKQESIPSFPRPKLDISKKIETNLVTLEPTNWTLLSMIWKHIKPHSGLLGLIVIITSCSAAVNIATPLVIGNLVTVIQNTLAGSNSFEFLKKPASQLFILFSSQGILTFVDIALVSKFGELIAKSIRLELFQSLLNQDLYFFDERMNGEVINRITQDVQEFKHTFKLCITQGLKATTQVVGSIISLISISPSLTGILGSTLPILYIGMNFYADYLRNISRRAKNVDSNTSGVCSEAIANIKTVRAFVSEIQESTRFEKSLEESERYNVHLGFHIGLFQGLVNTSIGSMILLILYFGGSFVSQGNMTGGQLMAYMVATQNTQRSLSSVGALIGQTIKAFGSASRVFEYMLHKPQIPLTGMTPSEFNGKIEFKNVSFRYPTRPNHQVLENVTLTIPQGAVIALCGSSGSGKSTVGQLIERFYEFDEGEILIDGHDIRNLDPHWIRKHTGYINQEPCLFATNILENIRYGNPSASDEQVYQAAKQANAIDFINNFPNKFQTVVGERGSTLRLICSNVVVVKNKELQLLELF